LEDEMASRIVYEDEWGEIIDRPDADLIEIRWYDSTATLTADGFQRWLTRFTEEVEKVGRKGILTDGTAFRMDPSQMDAEWRDANIVPRYNSAGVRAFAFHMPEGMPAIGGEPAIEGPAQYPTAYFGSRAEAVAWIAQSDG
jgi:hypothetical protein